MNRQLKLIQLYRNRQANQASYARIIRQELLPLDGHAAKRKQINTPISLGQTHTLRP
jgi:hypothetical protein